MKYRPETIYSEIAKIYNEAASSGQHPNELIHGILNALQKPNKTKGPIDHLRPIILLSMLRKILAVCMKSRINDRLHENIPPSQAAYRSWRSTTEHVFAAKVLAETAMSSKDNPIFILMLDMSKAFDTVNREILLRELSKVIEPDELHMISLMLKTELQVRCGSSFSDTIKTNTGVPQGDGLSANEFTFYLACAMTEPQCHTNEHCYAGKPQTLPFNDHTYSKKIEDEFTINMQYADDISIATSNPLTIDYAKLTLPPKLSQNHLYINDSKTEYYEIKRNGSTDWKKCKLLGSLLDTEADIDRRKGLAIGTINSMKKIFYGTLPIEIKVRAFQCYVSSIFLYNSELWTLTANTIKSIDGFHRKLLRTAVLNVSWPKVVSNQEVYATTKVESWSLVIKKRQLSWLGHLIRLPDDTPAKRSFEYIQKPRAKPRGRQPLTWLTMMKKMVESHCMQWEKACVLAEDRLQWKDFMRQCLT